MDRLKWKDLKPEQKLYFAQEGTKFITVKLVPYTFIAVSIMVIYVLFMPYTSWFTKNYNVNLSEVSIQETVVGTPALSNYVGNVPFSPNLSGKAEYVTFVSEDKTIFIPKMLLVDLDLTKPIQVEVDLLGIVGSVVQDVALQAGTNKE